MGITEVHPFGGEFRIQIQKGKEAGGEGGDPAGGFGSDDPFRGDFHHAYSQGGIIIGFAQNIIQYFRIGVFIQRGQFPDFFGSLFQGKGIFFRCFRKVHDMKPPAMHNFTHTS